MRAHRVYRALRTICTARATGAVPSPPGGPPDVGGATANAYKSHAARTVTCNASPEITPLAESLTRRIRFGAPLTVAEYMRECLTHPKHGYYTRLDALGARGDFITAPEVSQVFGELVGVWAASIATSQKLGEFRLIELGAGSGALLRDALNALRALRASPLRVDIVDASPSLRAAQRRALKDTGVTIYWHDAIGDALNAHSSPAVVVAQEFLDALPVHVLHAAHGTPRARARDSLAWRERLVDADDTGKLRWSVAPGATPASTAADSLLARWNAPPPRDGDVLEIALEALGVAERVGEHVASAGGGALFIDYATTSGSRRESLRAYRKHVQECPLTAPGLCDLTADVNFEHVRRAVDDIKLPVRAHGPVSQRALLLGLGAAHRFRALASAVIDNDKLTDVEKDSALGALQANYHSLVDEDKMGGRYSALSILPDSAPIPAGFEEHKEI